MMLATGAQAATDVVPLPLPRPAIPSVTGTEPPRPQASSQGVRAAIRRLIDREAEQAGLPPDIAAAVVEVESGYDATVVGRVGEIGLMQVRPPTAAMLGFRGTSAELAQPEVNIHYGVRYLSKAWRLANGDLCRALMKYRAGHGEENMTPLSVTYCDRARRYLAALNSPVSGPQGAPPSMPDATSVSAVLPKAAGSAISVYSRLGQGTPAASRAFWAAHEARVKAIKDRLRVKWSRVASR
ncbi:hypothetical protein BH10PSE11_BH10PSE11_38580 [soil metagenome]